MTRVNRKAPLSPQAKKVAGKALAAQRERIFLGHCQQLRLPTPIPEHRFDAVRKFRFDYAWPDQLVALEVDGGVWSGGAHGRGTGIVRDQEKGNLAACLGWRVLRVTPRQLTDGATATMVYQALYGGPRLTVVDV